MTSRTTLSPRSTIDCTIRPSSPSRMPSSSPASMNACTSSSVTSSSSLALFDEHAHEAGERSADRGHEPGVQPVGGEERQQDALGAFAGDDVGNGFPENQERAEHRHERHQKRLRRARRDEQHRHQHRRRNERTLKPEPERQQEAHRVLERARQVLRFPALLAIGADRDLAEVVEGDVDEREHERDHQEHPDADEREPSRRHPVTARGVVIRKRRRNRYSTRRISPSSVS